MKAPRIPRTIVEQLSKVWTPTRADEQQKTEIFGQNAWWREHQWPPQVKPGY